MAWGRSCTNKYVTVSVSVSAQYHDRHLYLPSTRSAIWDVPGESPGPGVPASPDSRPLSKRPRLEDNITPGHRPFVRGHYTVSYTSASGGRGGEGRGGALTASAVVPQCGVVEGGQWSLLSRLLQLTDRLQLVSGQL